jgi:predicted DCC family thiol-disulfide oxidoreductase YuxK
LIHNRPILFFDGVCNLCNGFVDFLITRDNSLLFAPLQGLTASHKLSPLLTQTLPSVVLIDEQGRVYLRSAAALRVLTGLGGLWLVLKIFLLLPGFLRDIIYNFIAANRYSWFGKKDSCRLPSLAERDRFLD